MAIGGGAIGSAIGGLIGGDKVKQHYFNKPLSKLYTDDYINALKDLSTRGSSALGAYEAAIAAATPEAKAIQAQDLGTLGGLIREGAAYNPLDAYERIRTGNISALTDQFGRLEDSGSAADRLALAARGYGGRGDSSYERTLRADRISRNVAPVLNTIFGNLGTDVTKTQSAGNNNLLSVLGLMREREAVPDRLATRALLPFQAGAGILGTQLGLAGDLGAGTRENTAGFEKKKNKWANFFEQMGVATDQAADTAMSLLPLFTGGMGGLGGIFGGGASAAPAASAVPAAAPVMYSYPGAGGFGSLMIR